MTLKELQILHETLIDLMDFVEANSDGDKSGVYDEIALKYSQSITLISKERYKLHLRNALARNKRKRK